MKLSAFGSYSFPMDLGEWGVPIEALSGSQQILGASGAWDDMGRLVVIGPRKVTSKFAIHGATWAAVDTDLDALRTALFKSDHGYNYLYAIMGEDAAASRIARARCLALEMPYKYDAPRVVVCQATFEMLQPHWDAIVASTSSPNTATFVLDNGGSTCDVQRTLAFRLNGPLTVLYTLSNATNGLTFSFDGAAHNVAAGHYVDVHCGWLTVVDDAGVDLWEHLTIGVNQIGFMRLYPGNNSITQGGATLALLVQWSKAYL